jgi:hypothetical protein
MDSAWKNFNIGIEIRVLRYRSTNFSLASAHIGWLSNIEKCLNEDPEVPPSNRPASPIDL